MMKILNKLIGLHKKFLQSRSESDAAFQLSHLKRAPAHSMPRCPSRGALSIHRNSWCPLTASQMNGGSGPGPAEANLYIFLTSSIMKNTFT